jgi:hypothetical protein
MWQGTVPSLVLATSPSRFLDPWASGSHDPGVCICCMPMPDTDTHTQSAVLPLCQFEHKELWTLCGLWTGSQPLKLWSAHCLKVFVLLGRGPLISALGWRQPLQAFSLHRCFWLNWYLMNSATSLNILKNYTFSHSVCMCGCVCVCVSVSVRIAEQTAILSLCSIDWLVCITQTECLLRGTDWNFQCYSG